MIYIIYYIVCAIFIIIILLCYTLHIISRMPKKLHIFIKNENLWGLEVANLCILTV